MQHPLSIEYNDKYIEEAVYTKFLDLHIGNYITGKIILSIWFQS
jgi:hypothetical protein